MSWAYFTAYLDGTRPILKAERDELADQLALKLVYPCGRFSLHAPTITAIKASNLITSMTAISDAGTPVAGAIYDLITITLAPSFSDLTGSIATALTGEGITLAELTAIIASKADSFRFWNFLKRLIDALQFADHPISFTRRAVGANATKWGHLEFGTASSPAKRYLRKAFDRRTRLCTGGTADPETGCAAPDCCTSTETWADEIDAASGALSEFVGYAQSGCTVPPGSLQCDFGLTSTTSTEVVYESASGLGCCTAGSGGETQTLLDEHTTAAILARARSNLPAFSSSFAAGTVEAFTDLNPDELTVTKRAVQYKITLPTFLAALGYTTFAMAWNETFTPEGGGSPTILNRLYVWDGSATETPVYTMDDPDAPGTKTLTDFSFGC